MSKAKKTLLIIFIIAAIATAAFQLGRRPRLVYNRYSPGSVDFQSSPSASQSLGFPGIFKESFSSRSSRQQNDESSSNNDSDQRKIIKNGNLSLVVKSVNSAVEEIKRITVENGGYVQSSSIRQISKDTKSGSITVRISAENFDKFFQAVKNLAVSVELENTSVSDVTERYADYQVQLKNWQTEEDSYREIMKKAKTVEEILKVSSKLNEVRGRIERLQAQIKRLENQVDLATISINLTSEAEVEVFGIKWKPLTNAKFAFRSAISSLASFADFIVWIILFIPTIILYTTLISVFVWLGFLIRKFAKKRFLK